MRYVAWVVVVCALAVFPAAGGDDESWRIAIGLHNEGVSNNDIILGTRSDGGSLPLGDVEAVEFGSELVTSYEIGHTWGSHELSVTVWNYDEDASRTVIDLSTGYLPAFGHPDNGDDFADRIDGRAQLEASAVDLAWSRTFAENDRSHWDWLIGLRAWSLEQNVELFTDLDPLTPGVFDTRVKTQSDAEGFGLVAGFGGRYDASDRVWGTADLKFGFLGGSVDTFYDEDSFGTPVLVRFEDSDRTFVQTELQLRVNFRVHRGLDAFVGYRFRQFQEAISATVFTDDYQPGAVVLQKDDVSFSGFSSGLTYRF